MRGRELLRPKNPPRPPRSVPPPHPNDRPDRAIHEAPALIPAPTIGDPHPLQIETLGPDRPRPPKNATTITVLAIPADLIEGAPRVSIHALLQDPTDLIDLISVIRAISAAVAAVVFYVRSDRWIDDSANRREFSFKILCLFLFFFLFFFPPFFSRFSFRHRD